MTMVAHSTGRVQEALRPGSPDGRRRRRATRRFPLRRERNRRRPGPRSPPSARQTRGRRRARERLAERACGARRGATRSAGACSCSECSARSALRSQTPRGPRSSAPAMTSTWRSRRLAHRGKFENLNVLLAEHSLHDRDWLIVLDDDVVLPRGFLDNLLFLAERFALDLAQPAHARASHAAWQVTRRRFGSVVRETSFVEIGPVTAFGALDLLDASALPGSCAWAGASTRTGLRSHSAHGWRCGVLDAVCIRHDAAPVAARLFAGGGAHGGSRIPRGPSLSAGVGAAAHPRDPPAVVSSR